MAGEITHVPKGNNLSRADYDGENTHLIGGEENLKIVRSATYVVAASDAPTHIKAQADYVCDGVADDVEIQAAFNLLTAGGTIHFSQGTFAISATVTLPNVKGITMEGENQWITTFQTPAGGIAGPVFVWAEPTELNQYWIFRDFGVYGKNTTPGYLFDLSQTEISSKLRLQELMIQCTNTSIPLCLDGNEDTITDHITSVATVASADPSVRWLVPDGAGFDIGSIWSGCTIQAQQFTCYNTVFGAGATLQTINLLSTIHGSNYHFIGVYTNGIPMPFIYLKTSSTAQPMSIVIESSAIILDNPSCLILDDTTHEYPVYVDFSGVFITNSADVPVAFPMFSDFTDKTIRNFLNILNIVANGVETPATHWELTST